MIQIKDKEKALIIDEGYIHNFKIDFDAKTIEITYYTDGDIEVDLFEYFNESDFMIQYNKLVKLLYLSTPEPTQEYVELESDGVHPDQVKCNIAGIRRNFGDINTLDDKVNKIYTELSVSLDILQNNLDKQQDQIYNIKANYRKH